MLGGLFTLGSKKKISDVITAGVEKVFEDTPYNRGIKCIEALTKQVSMSFNRLEMIVSHMKEEDFFKLMDLIIDLLYMVTNRAISIRDNKMGWANNNKEELPNDKSKGTTGEN